MQCLHHSDRRADYTRMGGDGTPLRWLEHGWNTSGTRLEHGSAGWNSAGTRLLAGTRVEMASQSMASKSMASKWPVSQWPCLNSPTINNSPSDVRQAYSSQIKSHPLTRKNNLVAQHSSTNIVLRGSSMAFAGAMFELAHNEQLTL